MVKKSAQTVFCCQSCGYKTPRWMGKCPECGEWESFVEESVRSRQIPGAGGKPSAAAVIPIPIDSVKIEIEDRLLTGIGEFDRVLGGGLVAGSLVLIGGDPGIGKSTLMLQALYGLTQNKHKVLYVSGEESIQQIKIRSQRLSTSASDILVASEVDLESILAMVASVKPQVLVIDSIQTMFSDDLTSAPGSVSQIRESTLRLMLMAKKTGIPTFLIGHVTKEGAIAGPRLLEHMVDTVLYFEGDRNHVFRILRAVKNRFGSTNEIGVFEMKDKGLDEVASPSAVFLAERPANEPGSAVTASMEGTRPILVELQALASRTNLATPRRTVLGLDYNKVSLLVAVMEKKLGMHLMGHDIFMNVAGGVKVDEPAVDLGIVASIASSFFDKPIPEGTVVMGEVGLTGEIRAVSHIETRAAEALNMGFTKCFMPQSNLKRMTQLDGMQMEEVRTLAEAIGLMF